METIIIEQAKKIQQTLKSISHIDIEENSTNERLQQIRRSMGKGAKRK